jgi:hypothetical protein
MEIAVDSRGPPSQFLGSLFIRHGPIVKSVRVELLEIFHDGGMPDGLSLPIQSFIPAKKHAKPGTERQVHWR